MSFGLSHVRKGSLALRALAALLACWLTSSPLLQLGHLLLVRHTVCAEHGELIEVSGHQASALGHQAASHHEEPAGDNSGETGEHEHCQVLGRNEPGPALAVQANEELFTAPTWGEIPLPFGDPAAHAGGLALLAVAPKTSPPNA